MNTWWRGRGAAFLALAVIVSLVLGGLGWVTFTAVRLEREQTDAHFEIDVRRALWRLDSKAFTLLGAEANRPFHESSAAPVETRLPSTSKDAVEIWKLTDPSAPAWVSRQYLVFPVHEWRPTIPNIRTMLMRTLGIKPGAFLPTESSLAATTYEMLKQLTWESSAVVPQQTANVGQSFSPEQIASDNIDRDTEARLRQGLMNRAQTQNVQQRATALSETLSVGMFTPRWVAVDGGPQLVVVRDVQVGERHVAQVSMVDWPALQSELAAEVKELLPSLTLRPVTDIAQSSPDRVMTALPVELEPGPPPPQLLWSPLQIGVALAWAAALIALAAVGLGGWSLLNLSDSRMRFVSAVTHELRTPLTTLRLYLDMLASGLVKDEVKKSEYIQTLNLEADRLNRLVGNVLDFSRLENQRPRLDLRTIAVAELLDQVHADWQTRCKSAAKDLIIENGLKDATIHTDVNLVAQILGNLIDNACKYSRDASDQRVWLRAQRDGDGAVRLEVEDRGQGIPAAQRKAIFRAFRRGNQETTSGGVGLGLALAKRWARLLGGDVTLLHGTDDGGACFQVRLPGAKSL